MRSLSSVCGVEIPVSSFHWRWPLTSTRFTRRSPNTVTPFTVDLHQPSYTFKAGHRIMVHVQSTWFPLYDRNPQTFVDNIFFAKPGDYRKATQRIWFTPERASVVEVSIATE